MAKGEPRRWRGGTAAQVTNTGLAVVHKGELVLPAAGSEAQAEFVAESDRTAVHYHFPVEVQVVEGGRGESQPHHVIDLAMHKLAQAVQSVNTG
jgi:hypothetical protein